MVKLQVVSLIFLGILECKLLFLFSLHVSFSVRVGIDFHTRWRVSSALLSLTLITALFTNMRILKFKSQLTIALFAAVNYLNGPLRKQNFTLTGSKGHGFWFVIGGFRSVLCVSKFVACDRNYDWGQRKIQLWRWLLNFRVRMCVKSAVTRFHKIWTQSFQFFLYDQRISTGFAEYLFRTLCFQYSFSFKSQPIAARNGTMNPSLCEIYRSYSLLSITHLSTTSALMLLYYVKFGTSMFTLNSMIYSSICVRGAPFPKGNRKLSMPEDLVVTSAYARTLVWSLREVVGFFLQWLAIFGPKEHWATHVILYANFDEELSSIAKRFFYNT